MRLTYDSLKRAKTLSERGLDFADAAEVFAGVTIDIPDLRRDFGEVRMITVGRLAGRMVVVVWTERDEGRRIISMRKTNEREQKVFGKRLGEG